MKIAHFSLILMFIHSPSFGDENPASQRLQFQRAYAQPNTELTLEERVAAALRSLASDHFQMRERTLAALIQVAESDQEFLNAVIRVGGQSSDVEIRQRIGILRTRVEAIRVNASQARYRALPESFKNLFAFLIRRPTNQDPQALHIRKLAAIGENGFQMGEQDGWDVWASVTIILRKTGTFRLSHQIWRHRDSTSTTARNLDYIEGSWRFENNRLVLPGVVELFDIGTRGPTEYETMLNAETRGCRIVHSRFSREIRFVHLRGIELAFDLWTAPLNFLQNIDVEPGQPYGLDIVDAEPE